MKKIIPLIFVTVFVTSCKDDNPPVIIEKAVEVEKIKVVEKPVIVEKPVYHEVFKDKIIEVEKIVTVEVEKEKVVTVNQPVVQTVTQEVVVVQQQVVEVEKEVDKFIAQDFEGRYYFANGGYLELLTDVDQKVHIVTSGQIINTENTFTNTLASHPTISGSYLIPNASKIITRTYNVNYHASHDNVQLSNGTPIAGNRRTDFIIALQPNKTIKLTIKIYDDQLGKETKVDITRELLSN